MIGYAAGTSRRHGALHRCNQTEILMADQDNGGAGRSRHDLTA
jgi:hypothetical protein